MGQADSQFKVFIRFVKEVAVEKDENKRSEKMVKIIENLQKTLED